MPHSTTSPSTCNEQLVRGREDIFFGAEFDASAGSKKLPPEVTAYYIDALRDADALRGTFGFYRAIPETTLQNQTRKDRRLTIPVLAMGGAESGMDGAGKAMQLVADDVQILVIPDAGHWVAEQAPEAIITALTTFLGSYHDEWASAIGAMAHAGAAR
jgi:pimeloyl-ACP methyl ester carboxylesterase